jgi:hypothetical protein
MLDYPLGRKLAKHLEFYLQQLQFEHESGRICALEMLSTIFNSFPQVCGLFYLLVSCILHMMDVPNGSSTVSLCFIEKFGCTDVSNLMGLQ